MKNNLAGNYELANDIDCSDTVNWNGGAGFEPVGSYSAQFNGGLDGRDHEIQDLSINRLASRAGLFSHLDSGAQIRNLALVSINISASRDDSSGDVTVAGLAAFNRGAITQCNVTGMISGTGGGSAYIAGLVGWNTGSLIHCHADVSVSSEGVAGGLVGVNLGVVTESYTVGFVSGGYDNVGGLIGENEVGTELIGHVLRCFSAATVSGGGVIGGLIGRNVGIVTQSYATGVASSAFAWAAALVGHNVDVSSGSGVITQCYATGAVSAPGDVGGLVADNGNTVEQSYWDIQTTGLTTSAGSDPSFGKTTVEMYMQTTFVGWDFISTWQIDEGNDYPKLQSLAAPIQQSPVPTPSAQPTPSQTLYPTKTPSLSPIPTNSSAPSSSPIPTANQTAPGGSSNNDLSDGAIAGIAIGATAGAAGLGVGLFVLAKKFGIASFFGKSSAVTPMQPINNA